MKAVCRILADDLTGALDCAAAFAGPAGVPVALGRPDCMPWQAPIEACASASRSVPEEALAGRLAPCLDWLKAAHLPFKKVDSLLRGNSFAELAWLASSGCFQRMVFAPAFPAFHRRVVDGEMRVDGTPATAPVSLRKALAAFGLQTSADGRARLGRTEIEMPDVLDDADLDAVVAGFSGLPDVLWCGSAGLAMALARAHGIGRDIGRRGALAGRAEDTLVATASRHPVLRAQLAHLATATLPARVRLEEFSSAGQLAQTQADEALGRGAVAIVAKTPPPGLLVVIGGDSLLALCEAARAQALIAGPPPRDGWGSARLVGGCWDGVLCVSRSGAFGAPDDLTNLLASFGATAPAQRSFF
jgi:uncharacterized protein YgbK (DUF1537 family)